MNKPHKATAQKYAIALNALKFATEQNGYRIHTEQIAELCKEHNVTATLYQLARELGYFRNSNGLTRCDVPVFEPIHGRKISELNSKLNRERVLRKKAEAKQMKIEEPIPVNEVTPQQIERLSESVKRKPAPGAMRAVSEPRQKSEYFYELKIFGIPVYSVRKSN